VALVGAVAVRVVAARGYPAPLWAGDTYGYLDAAVKFRPHVGRPSGYSVLLWVLAPFHDFGVVVAVQSALGVVAGVLVYAVVWRAARRAWGGDSVWRVLLPGALGTAAAVPVWFDGNQLQSEHLMLADSLFTFLVVAAVAAVLWPSRITWWSGGLAGLVISCAALTRLAGLPLLALVVLALVLRGNGWRRTVGAVVAAVIAFGVPFAAYLHWFERHHGAFAVTKADSVWLYGRTMAFADCAKIKPAPEIAALCPRPATDPRVAPAFRALWTADSPFVWIPGGMYGEQGNALAGKFADAAISAQFGDYLDVVWRDTLRAFASNRDPYPTPWTRDNTLFPPGESWADEQALLAERYGGSTGRVRVVDPYATWIRDYQRRWYTPGPLLGALMAVGLVGVVVRLRPRARFGGAGLLPWSMGAALVVIPAATADFDYRYLPPVVPLECLAAFLAVIPGGARRSDAVACAEPELASEPAFREPEPDLVTESAGGPPGARVSGEPGIQ
jgi:hypothetical protein